MIWMTGWIEYPVFLRSGLIKAIESRRKADVFNTRELPSGISQVEQMNKEEAAVHPFECGSPADSPLL